MFNKSSIFFSFLYEEDFIYLTDMAILLIGFPDENQLISETAMAI
jgi:hypothetical protein